MLPNHKKQRTYFHEPSHEYINAKRLYDERRSVFGKNINAELKKVTQNITLKGRTQRACSVLIERIINHLESSAQCLKNGFYNKRISTHINNHKLKKEDHEHTTVN